MGIPEIRKYNLDQLPGEKKGAWETLKDCKYNSIICTIHLGTCIADLAVQLWRESDTSYTAMPVRDGTLLK